MIMAGTSARWGCCWRGYTDGAGGAREAKSSAKLDHHLRGTGSSPSRNRIITFAEPDHHLRGTGSSPSRNRISTFAEPGSSDLRPAAHHDALVPHGTHRYHREERTGKLESVPTRTVSFA